MNLSRYRPTLLGFIILIVFGISNTSFAAPSMLDISAGNSPVMVLNRSRMPVIVYSSGLLQLATCTDLACPSASVISIPGTNSSTQPSLVLNTNEQPIIVLGREPTDVAP